MDLTHPLGLVLLSSLPLLVWWFRKKESLTHVRTVSSDRWFTPILARQAPVWRWNRWVLLVAGCLWYLVAVWTWVQPHLAGMPGTYEVWDGGLNMPDNGGPERFFTPGEWEEQLARHPGRISLHSNLQVAAWGEEIRLPSRVTVMPEPLPSSVGITRAGFLSDQVWVQIHNTTGTTAGVRVSLVTPNRREIASQQVAVAQTGTLAVLPVGSRVDRVRVVLDHRDPWSWDKEFYLARSPASQRIAVEAGNPYLRTWARLLAPAANPSVLVTEQADLPRWRALTAEGGTIVWFANNLDPSAWDSLGIRWTTHSALREQGLHLCESWQDLAGLRLVSFTTTGESTGWDEVLWGSESGRPIVGRKRWNGGSVIVVLGPLLPAQTELPTLPLFIPWMAKLTAQDVESTAANEDLTDPRVNPGWADGRTRNRDRRYLLAVAGTVRRSDASGPVSEPMDVKPLFALTVLLFGLILLHQWPKRS